MGNLDAKRDWGHAKDYVEMQWLMLQQETPQDFVIATGMQMSVRDFINASAEALGLALEWSGTGLDEVGTVIHVDESKKGISADQLLNKVIVNIDANYFRPTEVDSLLGDASKARETLGWKAKISFAEMVEEMVSFDLDKARRFKILKEKGFDLDLSDEWN